MANDVENVVFRRGPSSTIPSTKVPGTILIETDTGRVYVDDTESSRIQLKDDTKLPLEGTAKKSESDVNGNSLVGRITTVETDADTGVVTFKNEKGESKGTAVNSSYVEKRIKSMPDPILNNTIDADREDQASNGYSLSHVIEGDKHSFFNVKLDDTQSRIFHGYTVDSNNLRQVYSLTDANNAYLMMIGMKNGVKDVEAGFGRRNTAVQAYGMDTKFQWNLVTTGTIAQGVVADKAGTKSARLQVESNKAILRAKNGKNLIDANALADSSTLVITGGGNTISISASNSGTSITGLSDPANDTDAVNKSYLNRSVESYIDSITIDDGSID